MSGEEHDLHVTDEYFDYLLGELDRPAQADPRIVELLRATRGSIQHVAPPVEDEP